MVRTPLVPSPALSARLHAKVLLKLENEQHSGSFKVRGAFNTLFARLEETSTRGVVTASSGNHGAAVAWSSRELGVPAKVFVPHGASPLKVEKIRRFGATVEFHGTDGVDTELFARADAGSTGRVYVSPYNDELVIAGQGTIGVELLEQAPDLDAVVVAVGGGGLMAGIGTWIRAHAPHVKLIGAVPAASPVMAASVHAGRILEMETLPTLSDGTAGGIEAGAITFASCRRLVDYWMIVSEPEIERAMRDAVRDEGILVEGAAGVALAAANRIAPQFRGRQVAVVICGGNVDPTLLGRLSEG